MALSLTIAAASASILTVVRARMRERAAEAAFPPEGQILNVNGQKVHAVVTGEGPDLVLIHGSSGNTHDFTFSFVDQVKDRYRVIVFDRPGLGWSDPLPPGRASIFDQAALLQAAAAQLGARRPIVLGQSYGGAVALAWALDMPDTLSAVVSVAGPSHWWDTGLPLYYKLTSNLLGSALLVPLLTAWVPDRMVTSSVASVFTPQPMPKGYDRAIAAGLTLRRDSLRANALHRASLKGEIAQMQPRYGELTMPVELVHGDADDTVFLDIHSERLAAEVPTAELTALPGVGHMPHHVAAPEVIAAIDRAAARAGLH